MSVMAWSYSLAIRAKNSAGTVIGTYFAGKLDNGMVGNVMAIPSRIGPPTYEVRQLEREGWDYAQTPVVLGYRPHLTVAWEQRSPGIVGLPQGSWVSGGFTWHAAGVDLAPVLTFVTTVGDWLEVSLDGGATWRACNLESNEIAYQPIDGKAVGVALELAFAGRKLISVVPDLAPASWGTAV